MDHRVKGQKAKPKVEINEISARAFGQFYQRGETTGILRWDEVDNEIQLEAINISTELAIKNKKNNQDQEVKGHGFMRILSPVGCIRKTRKDDCTTTPTRY